MTEQKTGNAVTIEAYRHEHIDALFEAVSESIPEISQYETWCHPGCTRDEAAQYVNWWRKAWEERTGTYFAVVESSTKRFLGSCGLNGPIKSHRRAGLGYWIRSNSTGCGFGTDAARMVMRYGFDELNLERIEMEIAVDNLASLRIAEKLGFHHEGVLRHRLILPSGPTDMIICSRLAEDRSE